MTGMTIGFQPACRRRNHTVVSAARWPEKQKAGTEPTFPLPRNGASTSVVAARSEVSRQALGKRNLNARRLLRSGLRFHMRDVAAHVAGRLRIGFAELLL